MRFASTSYSGRHAKFVVVKLGSADRSQRRVRLVDDKSEDPVFSGKPVSAEIVPVAARSRGNAADSIIRKGAIRECVYVLRGEEKAEAWDVSGDQLSGFD